MSLPPPSSPPSHPTPAYTRLPAGDEHRILLPPTSPLGNALFTKRSKSGSLVLHIFDQPAGIHLPVFGDAHHIRASVQIAKCDSVASVDLKLEGFLRLREVGGAGTLSDSILSQQLNLWSKTGVEPCPSSLDADLRLASTYRKENETYPLPPTYEVHLSGVPGFRADVEYTISVCVTKTKGSLFGNHTIVSTPFIYQPRTRPTNLSPALRSITVGDGGQGWEIVESTMKTRSPQTQPIITKLYIPAGRTYCMKRPIPFRFQIESSALSLATFLPCSPTAANQQKHKDDKNGVTRIEVIRQVSVDVRNVQFVGIKTDIFKVVAVGQAKFKLLGDGADWAAWDGEIHLDENLIGVGSFKAGGLWVKDYIVLSIVPPGSHSSPLLELRTTVPIRLVTDPASSDAPLVLTEWPDHKSVSY